VRRSIGVTGQFSAIDDYHTGRENLKLMADLNHLDRRRAKTVIDELLERFELADAAGRRAQTYSGGIKRRLDLAMTLIGSPRLIFLDEPTTGLDPRGRREVWQIVRERVADGVTVLLTTQYLDEADQLAHRVGVLDLHGNRCVRRRDEGCFARIGVRLDRSQPAHGRRVMFEEPAPPTTHLDHHTADAGQQFLVQRGQRGVGAALLPAQEPSQQHGHRFAVSASGHGQREVQSAPRSEGVAAPDESRGDQQAA
jgi:ABC-type multidrug transport system ATPase subunit